MKTHPKKPLHHRDHACVVCDTAFNSHFNDRWCSNECYLKGHTEQQGDCWVWTAPGKQVTRASQGIASVSLGQFVASILGKVIPTNKDFAPTCGKRRCLNPAHFGTVPKRGRPGTTNRLSRVTVLNIYESEGSCEAVAKRYGCSPAMVSNIRRGIAHRKITGA